VTRRIEPAKRIAGDDGALLTTLVRGEEQS
jgi:hypothetical protein